MNNQDMRKIIINCLSPYGSCTGCILQNSKLNYGECVAKRMDMIINEIKQDAYKEIINTLIEDSKNYFVSSMFITMMKLRLKEFLNEVQQND